MQTPFAEALSTNYVPIGPEIEQIHQLIAGPVEQISRLDERIGRFQAIIDHLTRERDSLSRFVLDHRALLSGARRLPQELVQEVFFHCLPTCRNAVMSSDEPPLLLGRICSSWRRIALSTPQLWSSLHVPIPEPVFLTTYGDSILSQLGEAVKVWLERSGCCPLSMSLTADTYPSQASSATTHLLQIMTQFSRRWKNIEITLPSSIFCECLANLEEVPVLEQIVWHPIDDLPHSDSHPCSAPMLQTPSLRHVSLPFADYSRLVPQWEYLTYLSTTGSGWNNGALSPPRAIGILNQCSNLITCKMRIESGGSWAPSVIPAVTSPPLHKLESLEIQESGNTDLAVFFDALRAPGLRHLSYSRQFIITPNYSDVNVPFKSLIMQPHTTGIESFELGLKAISRDELIADCLAHLPFLKRLNLVGAVPPWSQPYDDPPGHTNNDLIALLTPSSDSGTCLCPALEEIRFENAVITDDTLFNFLAARSRPSHDTAVVRLKRAKFFLLRPLVVNLMDDLRPFITDGLLQVDLDYLPNNDLIANCPCSPWRGLPRENPDVWVT